jgi:hypothetical protein
MEPDSNITLKSLKQPLKQLEPRVSTDEGMHIHESDEQLEKTGLSRRKSLEFDSNVTVVRFEHPSKQ